MARSISIILLSVILSIPLYPQKPGWQWSNPLPQGNALNAIGVPDGNTIVAAGDYGTVIRSADRGAHWSVSMITAGSMDGITDLCFADSVHGWFLDSYGMLYQTANGGIDWAGVVKLPVMVPASIRMQDASHGWICGDSLIARTTDGGRTWTTRGFGSNFFPKEICFIQDSLGWMVGNRTKEITTFGEVYRTRDGGATWVRDTTSAQDFISGIRMMNDSIGWILPGRRTTNGGNTWEADSTLLDVITLEPAGGMTAYAVNASGTVRKTTDGGVEWQTVLDSLNVGNARMAWTDPDHGYLTDGSNPPRLYGTTNGGAGWETFIKGNRDTYLSVRFINDSLGWATGDNGAIMHTTNGGISWISQQSGKTEMIWSVDFIDSLRGWACGDNGTTFRTTNGGTDWITGWTGTYQRMECIDMIDSSTGWMVGGMWATGSILKTTDGGVSWIIQKDEPGMWPLCVRFLDADTGWVTGASGLLLKTTDAGNSWRTITSPTGGWHLALDFPTPSTVVVVGFDNVFRSTDYGESWIVNSDIPGHNFEIVRFADRFTGYAAGSDGVIARTTDGGESWALQMLFTDDYFYGLDCFGKGKAWVVGANGAILLTKSGGDSITGIVAHHRSLPLNFALLPNYPNPFNPSTTVSYVVGHPSLVRVRIYDLLGREVADLVDERKQPGKYQVVWNAGRLPTGAYYCRLEAGDFSQTRAFIILR